jgi:acetyl-CoA carboxylase biotin carboxyl carrier protein
MSDQPVDWNLEELKELIRLLRESNVSEFELRRADYRLRIKQGFVMEEAPTAVSRTSVPTNGEETSSTGVAVTQPESEPPVAKESHHEIRSPIVGTFYCCSSPGSAPFVDVGDTVRKNQVLCIVEAMKIMNEIESDVDGEVVAVHVANGQPVEFGELLFSMRPAGI